LLNLPPFRLNITKRQHTFTNTYELCIKTNYFHPRSARGNISYIETDRLFLSIYRIVHGTTADYVKE